MALKIESKTVRLQLQHRFYGGTVYLTMSATGQNLYQFLNANSELTILTLHFVTTIIC